jgi:hypothetical protein
MMITIPDSPTSDLFGEFKKMILESNDEVIEFDASRLERASYGSIQFILSTIKWAQKNNKKVTIFNNTTLIKDSCNIIAVQLVTGQDQA